MEGIKLKARAKINLTIDVLNKRQDGYHEVEMIMQTVDLHDDIYIQKTEKEGIKLVSNLSWLPSDDRNLAYKACKLMLDNYEIRGGVFIELLKRIPVGAGLGGGSADCAAVLMGMKKLYDLNISKEEILNLSLSLGSDVPYCVKRGTALAQGTGQRLTMLPVCPFGYVVIVKPHLSISTSSVYQNFNLTKIKKHPDKDAMINAIKEKSISDISKNLCNVLEEPVMEDYPVIKEIKDIFSGTGSYNSLVSGTGSAVFSLYSEYAKAYSAFAAFKKHGKFKEVFLTTIYNYKKKEKYFYGRHN